MLTLIACHWNRVNMYCEKVFAEAENTQACNQQGKQRKDTQ